MWLPCWEKVKLEVECHWRSKSLAMCPGKACLVPSFCFLATMGNNICSNNFLSPEKDLSFRLNLWSIWPQTESNHEPKVNFFSHRLFSQIFLSKRKKLLRGRIPSHLSCLPYVTVHFLFSKAEVRNLSDVSVFTSFSTHIRKVLSTLMNYGIKFGIFG